MQRGNWNKLVLKWKMSFTWINKRKNASQQRSCAFINSYISAHLNFIWSLNLRTSRNVFCSLVILQSKIILLLSSFSQYIMPNRVAVCDRFMSICLGKAGNRRHFNLPCMARPQKQFKKLDVVQCRGGFSFSQALSNHHTRISCSMV